MPRSLSTGKIVRPKALAVSSTMNEGQDHGPVDREKLFASKSNPPSQSTRMMDAQACDKDYLPTIVLLPRIHQHDAPLVQNLIFAGTRTLHQAALAATHQTLEIDVILPGSPDIPLGVVEKKNTEKLERIMKYVSVVPLLFC